MKLLTALFFSFVIFLSSVNFAHAYDLEVVCDDTYCDLFSNNPIFDGGNLVPGESVEREINIKNNGREKEIFFRVESAGHEALDDTVNLKIFTDGNFLWEGTLEELFEKDEISVGNFSSGTSVVMSVSAILPELSLNEIQGMTSSAFDFGFGFEGDLSGKVEDAGDGDSGRGEVDGTSDAENGEGNILSGIFTTFTAPFAGVAEAEGVSTASGETLGISDEKNVLGSREACANNYIWTIFVALQIAVGSIYLFYKIGKKKLFAIMPLLVSVIAFLSVIFFFCSIWPVYLVLALVLLTYILKFRARIRGFVKRKKS